MVTPTQFLTGMHGVVLKNKEVDVSGVEPMYSCLQDEVSVQVRDILLFSFSLMFSLRKERMSLTNAVAHTKN
jgi:hypothetical protein